MSRLTTKDRAALPKGEFALPGKGEGPAGKGAGSYPIPDANHARNALARVSQHGSTEEKTKVREAVHRRFPDIGKPDHKAEHNDNGMIKAMHDHADREHPVSR